MRAVSSFKQQYRAVPPCATPPPPAYEPLSPVLRASDPADTDAKHASNGFHGAAQQTPASASAARAPLLLSSPGQPDPPLRSAPSASAKPAAIPATHASPTYGTTNDAAVSPSAAPHPPSSQRAPKHAFAYDPAYSAHGPPAKRARSEFYSSPPHAHHHIRPATSGHWSYNVEQMVDNRTRMYQDGTARAAPLHDEKRLSDAELLLNFAASASSSTSHASSSKRWSISHAPPLQVPLLQNHEASSPFAGPPYPTYSRPRHAYPPGDYAYPPEQPKFTPEVAPTASAIQTHTPPDDSSNRAHASAAHEANGAEAHRHKKSHGWPKGKPRGPRSVAAGGKKKRVTPKPKSMPTAGNEPTEQLHSPQSLPAEKQETARVGNTQIDGGGVSGQSAPSSSTASHGRRHSFNLPGDQPQIQSADVVERGPRARSAPLDTGMAETTSLGQVPQAAEHRTIEFNPDPVCAGCHSTESQTLIGEGEQWISCDGCKEWYHFVCAGFNSEREVRDVDKFYCGPCRPKFGNTTKVRKSTRVHSTIDYAGLNEGILKTSDDNPEHHYIAAFKNGDIEFAPETFARMPPELVTADFLEKTNGFKEPILIPAGLNPRPTFPGREPPVLPSQGESTKVNDSELESSHFEYEIAPDDGQDRLDMIIPEGLTVRRVAELYGPQEPVPVIDVKAQEGEDKKWTMGKWADYYEQQGEKKVRNVISLEVSQSRLGKLIRRPKVVRDMDLQDSVWEDSDKFAPPPVQFYCLMSVADCYTDFHIDFGGSSVYYHIVKGKKVFFFIPPTKQNLKKYEDWCLSPRQSHEFLGKQVKECYRVDLEPGDTMLIPSGWIHAVWTPENSLVIGGNFLTRVHYGMQIKIWEIEKSTKVALKFRYPFFQKILWLASIKYLEEDPLPLSVEQVLVGGGQFERDIPIWCEPDRFGHNSHSGPQNYNRRYYPKAELDGLTDLLNFIWRTVLISVGKIDTTQTVRNAVTRSIPKHHGDPVTLARKLAMWIAWKKGNENIPQWAYPDANLPEVAETGERKVSAAQAKRLERESWSDATRERQSARIKATDTSLHNGAEDHAEASTPSAQSLLTGFLRPAADPSRHMTTPKTSQLGPKRIACDACRKRRIRCKHKDEIVETKTGQHAHMSTLDLSGSLGLSVKRRLSEPYGTQKKDATVVNGGPISADLAADPYALKSGRVKACADCRKSKRRCIHDEYGNVDPIKANEVPIPRGSAGKKRRVSEEDVGSIKKMKHEHEHEHGVDGTGVNGSIHSRNSLPSSLDFGANSNLQDIAFSAQQALRQSSVDDDVMPIDPALSSWTNGDTLDPMPTATSQPLHRDTAVSSIESNTDGPIPMEDVVETGAWARGEHLGAPSVEPLTPGPNSYSETNGVLNGLSSPVSPLPVRLISSPKINHKDTSRAPPKTPVATNSHGSLQPSSSRKPSQTPSWLTNSARKSKTPKSTPGGRRRDSKDNVKLEKGSATTMTAEQDSSPEELASLQLAMQLQQEEHGLRRRSKGA